MEIESIYLDLDGVLANFVKGAVTMAFHKSELEYADILDNWPEGEWSVHVPLGLNSESEIWDEIDRQDDASEP